jgi:hypothetical protein
MVTIRLWGYNTFMNSFWGKLSWKGNSKLRRAPLTAVPIILFLVYLFCLRVFGIPDDRSLEVLEVLAISFIGCIVLDFLRLILHFAPIPGGRVVKQSVLIVSGAAMVGFGMYCVLLMQELNAKHSDFSTNTGSVSIPTNADNTFTYYPAATSSRI